MTVIVAAVCVAVILAAVLVRRSRQRAALERHCITPENLHALQASGQNVAVFDVRLPLDLLGHSVVIPGATWMSPEDVIANPSLIPGDRDAVVYCTCPGDETSRAVLRRALSLGIQRIRFLKGGIEGWQSRGYPVEPYDKPFHLNTGRKGAAVAP
jgi:rhodanese-related sulfurtransferase